MASDIEKLIVSLEARTRSFESALNKANSTAKSQLKKLESQFQATNKKLSLSASFSGLGNIGGLAKGGVAGLAGGLAIDKIKDYADAWTVAGNKIAAASVISGRSARSLDDINKIATETRSGITDTVDLYAKLLRATAGVAKNEQEVATATEVVNKAFKAGGADASEQAAGVLQLSQALSSGILQGDELRSIRENAPLIASAIAQEFKTTIGGLKQLGADGKLTVDRVFKAILDAKPQIDKAFGATNATIGDNLGLMNNALTAFIGKLSQVSGAGGEVGRFLGHDMVAAIDSLSTALDGLKNSDGVGILTRIADALNTINEFSQKIGGSIGGASGLGGLGAAISGAAGGDDLAKQFADAKDEADKLFDRLDRAAKAGVISQGQADAFAALRKQLRDGTIDADGASKAIASIADGTPALADLPSKFDAIISRVKKLAEEAEKAAAATAKVADIPVDPANAGWAMKHRDTVAQNFIDQRDKDAGRSDIQKDIDTRAKQIEEAAGKVGIAITEAAAKIQAAKEVAAEDIAKSASKSSANSVDLVKQFEGFTSKAKYDVNAYRAGFGSDTVTLADGSIEKISKGMSVSVADANRDLVRRIGEFQDKIKGQIGADTFNGMDENQQAALTSIAYNYGSLPERIVDAIKTGNQATVVQAIRGLGSDNGGINKDRRNTEADTFLGGAPSGVQKSVKAEDKFKENLSDTQLQIDLLNKQAAALGLVNPLINDYGYAQSLAEIKQKLLNDAMDNGITITPEYAAQIDALALKYASADAARNQMQQGVDNLGERMQQSAAFGKDLLGGFISDLKDGKSATEALSNALGKVADKLLDIGLNALFNGGGIGATPGGGILGGLFSFLFAKGGYTGDGGKNEPAGIVHKGEVVFSQDDVKRFGGARNVERMRRGYADGGIVGMPSIPALSTPSIPSKVGGGSNDTVRLVLQDDSGRMSEIADQRVKTHSGTIVEIAVQRSQKATQRNMPSYLADAQSRRL